VLRASPHRRGLRCSDDVPVVDARPAVGTPPLQLRSLDGFRLLSSLVGAGHGLLFRTGHGGQSRPRLAGKRRYNERH
jgi:hypothetical protein